MVNIVTQQGLRALGRQQAIALGRFFLLYHDPRQFYFLFYTAIIVDDHNFLIRPLEKALDQARLGSAFKVDPVARHNAIVTVNFGIVLIDAVATAENKLLRESDKHRRAGIATTQQRNLRIHSPESRIHLAGIDAVFHYLLAAAAKQPLCVQPMWKLGTHVLVWRVRCGV